MFDDAVAENRLFFIQSATPGYKTSSWSIARTLGKTVGYWHVVYKNGTTYVIAQNGAEVLQNQF
ncbi:hypothetical protein J7M28_08865 [bacterium]|nr:hypothetical protein [bacterium]